MADALPISGLTLKTTPADQADIIPIYDSLTGTTKGIEFGQMNAASGGLISLKYTLTSADILSSDTIFPVIIPAPGAGYAIKIESCAARINFNTTAYSSVGIANNSALTPLSNTNQQVIISYVNLIFSATTRIASIGLTTSYPNMIENEDIVFKNLGTAYINGDSTIDLYLTYRIITL